MDNLHGLQFLTALDDVSRIDLMIKIGCGVGTVTQCSTQTYCCILNGAFKQFYGLKYTKQSQTAYYTNSFEGKAQFMHI